MSIDVRIAEHYDELKQLAHRLLRSRHQTLQTTALVHELFLKLKGSSADLSDSHLMNLAARAMRQILVDAARRRESDKRGGDLIAVTLTERSAGDDPAQNIDVLALERSLIRLEELAPTLANIVELHFFAGLTMPEIAKLQGVTERTVFRHWRAARAQIQLDLQA